MESLEVKIQKVKKSLDEKEDVLVNLKRDYDISVKALKEEKKNELKVLKKLEQLQEKINEIYSTVTPEEQVVIGDTAPENSYAENRE